MVLRRIFGDRAPHKHIQTYPNNPSDAWMEREQQRLLGIAEELGVDVRTLRRGDTIELGFGNVKDAALLRLRAFGNDHNPGMHVHEENFIPGDEAYRDAWLGHAQAAIDAMGLACRIERDGDHRVLFRFDTTGDVALFTEMRDRGVFHERAMADLAGPSPAI